MARGFAHDHHDRPHDAQRDAHAAAGVPAPRVLVVSQSDARRTAWCALARSADVICGLAESAQGALSLLDAPGGPAPDRARQFEVVVLDVPACNPAALRFIRELGDRDVPALVVCPSVTFDEAVEVMRAGACDIVPSTAKPKELLRRLRSAIAQTRSTRAGRGEAPSVVADAPGATEAPVAPAGVRQRATPIKAGATDAPRTPADLADEFGVQIRCELDVESLLRQALEFVLANAGPTNAAVFLPSTTGDYSLGAYVNYTCPKDTAEVLLDHLANVAAPRLERLEQPLLLTDAAAITEHVGDGVDWMLDNHVLAFACRAGGECLALVLLFRDRQLSFNARAVELCAAIAGRFGEQLARVVRIHHRHLPRDKWGGPGDADAASDGGEDGLAA